jgi:hypothetical protein
MEHMMEQQTQEGIVNSVRTAIQDSLHDFQRMIFDMAPYSGVDTNLYLLPETCEYPLANSAGDISLKYLKEALLYIESLEPSIRRLELATHYLRVTSNATATDEDILARIRKILATPLEDGEYRHIEIDSHKDVALYQFPINATLQTLEFNNATVDDTGLIWRTVLRTGTWTAPVKNSPWTEGDYLVITKERLETLLNSFYDGAFEYVTVPDTHNETPLANKGFIREMKIVENGDNYELKAGFEITNEETKNAIMEGSIAGVSCGIIFDHIRTSDKKKFEAAVFHVALTNQPYIDGLGEWEKIAASLNIANIIVGTEENTSMMTETNSQTQTISAEEMAAVQAELAEARRLADHYKLTARRSEVQTVLSKYQTEKHFTPAMLTAIEPVLLSATVNETKVLTLSQDGKSEEVDLANAIIAMLDAMPALADLTSVTDTDGNEVTPDQTAPAHATEQKTLSAAERAEQIRKELGLSLAKEAK